jgi:beta-glucosidase
VTDAAPATLPRDATDAAALAGRFPPDFAWGAATAAYQIEGAVDAEGRGPSIWDTFSHTPGRVRNGETGDVACDHYRRWRDDVDLMAALGLRAYRFSVAWPRVQPAGDGAVNEAGLDFYDRLVDGLLERGIEPWLTLYHWDLPDALEQRGGWRNPEIVDRFASYAAVVGRRLGDRVRHWLTLNEPQVFAVVGHAEGRHAPGLRDWAAALRVAHHANLAHAAATEALRREARGARIGLALNLVGYEPASPRPEDVEAADRVDGAANRWFLDPIFGRGYPRDVAALHGALLDGIDPDAVNGLRPPDLLGINYYTRERVAAAGNGVDHLRARIVRPRMRRTTMGWEVYPDGLRLVLERVHREYRPASMAVTENGAAYADRPARDGSVLDAERVAYLAAHIGAVADAREAGVPVDGYFVWSLLDNFEWAEGYSQRFGVVRVDFETQRRTIKASGHWYRELLSSAPGT